MDENKKTQLTKRSFFSPFIYLLLLCFIFNVFYTHPASSMDFEDDNASDTATPSSVKLKKLRSSTIDSVPFIVVAEGEQANHLYTFIQKYLIHHDTISESKLKKILRTSGQVGGGTLGSLAGVPYFEVGRKAAGSNKIVSLGIGLTTTLAVSGTGAWSYFNLLKNLEPQSEEEKNLLQKSRALVLARVSSHGLGLIAAVPTAYLAARFNTHIWLAGISFGLEYSLKTNGFQTFFTNVLSQKSQAKQSVLEDDQTIRETALLETPPLLINHLLKKTIPSLITMQEEERNEFIDSLYREENVTVENYLTSLLNLPSPNVSLQETPDTWKQGHPRKAFVGTLSLSALLNVVHNFHCAYGAWQLFYDHPLFTVPMAVFSVAPTFALELLATVKTGRGLYDSVFYHFTGGESPSLARALYPRFMRALPIVCVSLAGVTAYVGRYMVLDVLHDIFPHEYSLFFSIGGVLGPFLFTSYANYSLAQDLLLGYTRSYGEDPQKKLALLIQDIEKLAQVVSLTKPEEMEKFLGSTSIQSALSSLVKEDAKEGAPQAQEDDSREGSRKKPQNPIKCGIM